MEIPLKIKNPILVTATIYVAGFTGYLTVFPQIAENFQTFCNTLDITQTSGLAILCVPLLLALVVSTKKNILDHRKSLHSEFLNKNIGKTSQFQLRPFFGTKTDIKAYRSYRRADEIEDQLIHWIENTEETILYLTGKSGVGKSSLVSAVVFPELVKSAQKKGEVLNAIVTRVYQDPHQDLKQTLLNLEGVWEKPPTTKCLRQLLEEAVVRSSLILAIDQFEELLILHNKESRLQFEETLKNLINKPIPNLKLLFVCRNDYLAEIEKSARFLPTLRSYENWRQVGLFNRDMAAQFLKKSIRDIDRQLMRTLLKEANEVEGTYGQYRPIVLNMLGLALEQELTYKSLIKNKGQLLQKFLESRLNNNTLHCQILTSMITTHKTKSPITVDDLSKKTEISLTIAQGVLRQLQATGFVRQIDELEYSWEISHDFLAQLLVNFITNWKARVLYQVKLWMIPVICFIILLYFTLLETQESQSFKLQQEIITSGMKIKISSKGLHIETHLNTGNKISHSIDLIVDYSEYGKVDRLTISGGGIDTLPDSIGKIKHLRQLDINNIAIKRLPKTIGQLTQLNKLTISGNGFLITIPESIGQLIQLRTLEITNNKDLKTLPNSLINLKNTMIVTDIE